MPKTLAEHRVSIETIFAAAVSISTHADRSAYLEQVCDNDAIRLEVERLCDAHLAAGNFMESPLGEIRTDPSPRYSDQIDSLDNCTMDQIGEVIDGYTLLSLIGEGGMGTVYLAQQHTPVRRKVAFKIIRPGMDSKRVVARFESERQVLAMMNHDGIAKVWDGGATPGGRPYFVMELVDGESIVKYCNHRHLSLSARLQLFVRVCQAIEHAHKKGIIHRDIKPSNVLVTEIDG